jgi:hypothetical protein|tara:strand:- start:299 stop:469 length:171 start_codon:yes stop_codon:yes gene_type:complete
MGGVMATFLGTLNARPFEFSRHNGGRFGNFERSIVGTFVFVVVAATFAQITFDVKP